jgi:hypothetical protein
VLSAEGSAPEGKGLRSLPMVFMDEGAEAIAAHDRTGGLTGSRPRVFEDRGRNEASRGCSA